MLFSYLVSRSVSVFVWFSLLSSFPYVFSHLRQDIYIVKLYDVSSECREARLLSLFRFKIWWMIPRVGCSAKDIPVETQMLLLEEPYSEEAENTAYVLFLPILDGEFRSSLQGNLANELELCVESGMYCLLNVCLSWSHYVQVVS